MKVAQIDIERTPSTSRKLKAELGEALKRERILEAKLRNQVKRNLRLDETCKGLEDELLLQHQRCEQLEKRLKEQALLDSKISDLTRQVENLQGTNKRLVIQLDMEKRHQTGAEDERDRFRQQLSRLEQEKRRLESCLAQAVESRERTLLENGYLKSEIVDLRNRLLKSHLKQSSKPHSFWDQQVHEEFD